MSIEETFKRNTMAALPADAGWAMLIGRVWRPEKQGPSPVVVWDDTVYDISSVYPTISHLTETDDPTAALTSLLVRIDKMDCLGPIEAILENSLEAKRDDEKPWLLAPVDLHAVKAAGVTFAKSMLERVIEERAGGDAKAAASIRDEIEQSIGTSIQTLRPGSDEALELKSFLQERGLWSQYLEVGIGPDAEIFTKAQILSSVGHGAEIGLHPMSSWNNPEPEVVLIVSSQRKIVGATLGNDVNLRDVEGRSALLLGKAKDNNGSCSIGPFIRLFDTKFTLADVESETIELTVHGEDGFVLEGQSSMNEISRKPSELVAQLMGAHHQYPDGAALFLGTMFAPTKDRDQTDRGFTHKLGDAVTIRSKKLGSLVNRVNRSDACAPWTFGVSSLIQNLSARNLI